MERLIWPPVGRRAEGQGIHWRTACRYGIIALTLLGSLAAGLIGLSRVQASSRPPQLVGPRKYVLSMGDSLAFGYQPDLNLAEGYSHDFFLDLRHHGVRSSINLGCVGESTTTMIAGGCPTALVRKYPYSGPQLSEALALLRELRGSVSPVTLDIGANDVLPALDLATCTEQQVLFSSHLLVLEQNLRVIISALHSALTSEDGQPLGDLIVANSYNPAQNACPSTKQAVQSINQAIARAVGSLGRIADIYMAFGGNHPTPNLILCAYTWMCSHNPFINPTVLPGQSVLAAPLPEVSASIERLQAIHPTSKGYAVMAEVFESTIGY